MHDCVQYDPIQGQGHEPLKVGNSAIFKGYLVPHLQLLFTQPKAGPAPLGTSVLVLAPSAFAPRCLGSV